MTTVALKGVRKEVWQEFKSDSAKHGMRMGNFFEKIVQEHHAQEGQIKKSWDHILRGKPTLTKKEAEELKSAFQEFRKGFTFPTRL